MKLRLRQIALAAGDLTAVKNDVAAIFGVTHFHDDPEILRYGLRNAVCPFGTSFLELLTPVVEETTVGRLLARRGGDGGYMVILQTDDIEEARARIQAADVQVVGQLDRKGAGFTHLHPRAVGGTLLSIDYMNEWDRWEWAGPDWEAHAAPASKIAIVGAEMQGTDPEGMASRWSTLLNRLAVPCGDGWRIALDEGDLRFVPLCDDRGEGFRAFDVSTAYPEAVRAQAAKRGHLGPDGNVQLCGMSVRILGAAA